MKIEIKNYHTGETIFKRDAESLVQAVGLARAQNANLRSADLSYADLSSIKIAWQSHDLIAQILANEAGSDAQKRSFAGLVLTSRDWCWTEFSKVRHPARKWAIGVLATLDPEGRPDLLTAILERKKK